MLSKLKKKRKAPPLNLDERPESLITRSKPPPIPTKIRQAFPEPSIEGELAIDSWEALLLKATNMFPKVSDVIFAERPDASGLEMEIQGPCDFGLFQLTKQWRDGFQHFLEAIYEMEIPRKRGRALEGTCSMGPFRLRSSLSDHMGGRELTCRLLPNGIPNPSDLQIEDSITKRFNQEEWGLVLVAGPTGSGKSTTIASLVNNRAQTFGGRYVTLEDPIEFLYPPTPGATFSQRAIGVHVDSFAQGLRDVKRQSPNGGVVVQEIRSSEEARIALEAALAGIFVVASIHGGDVQTGIRRFNELCSGEGVSERGGLSMALRIAICQKLKVDATGKLGAVREVCWNSSSIANHIRTGDFDRINQVIELNHASGMRLFGREDR